MYAEIPMPVFKKDSNTYIVRSFPGRLGTMATLIYVTPAPDKTAYCTVTPTVAGDRSKLVKHSRLNSFRSGCPCQ
jgi:hypothetical protein